jgi:MFS family permease
LGLVYGIVYCGPGLAALLFPSLVGPLLGTYGWKGAYIGLAALTLCTVPVIALLLKSQCAAAVFLFSACGLLMLASGNQILLLPGALAMGFVIGSEFNLALFLIGRRFPPAHFSTLFGGIYFAVSIGGGIGPILAGTTYDARAVIFLGLPSPLLACSFHLSSAWLRACPCFEMARSREAPREREQRLAAAGQLRSIPQSVADRRQADASRARLDEAVGSIMRKVWLDRAASK